jgi:hypothetical protein
MNCENKDAINAIQKDISDIKVDLGYHMSRTKANEDRIEFIEDWLMKDRQDTFERYEKMNKNANAFAFKILTGVIGAFLIPFLLKLLGLF